MRMHLILPTNLKRWAPFGVLLAAIALSFFYNLDGAPLFDRDEGAFSECTREMVQRGDFISTTLNGSPRYDKPILTYWLQALCVLLFSVSELAFRLPSAIAAALWVFAVYTFTRNQSDQQTGWVAAMMMTTTAWIAIIGRAATADALVNLFIALSLFDSYRYAQENNAWAYKRVFLWTGLGFLTKGPICVLIPMMVSGIFFALQQQGRRWLKAVFNPIGIAIFLAVALPWYFVQYLREGEAFLAGFFWKHNIGRYLAPMEGHGGGVYYYLVMVFFVIFPYSTLFASLLRRLRNIRQTPFDLFLWLWFLCVLVFFSFSGTKLPHYLLHGCTPLFILMARYRADLRSRILALLPVLVFFLILLGLPEIIAQVRAHLNDAYIIAMLGEADAVFGWEYRVWAAIACVAGVALLFIKSLTAWRAVLMAGLFNLFLLSHLVIPAAGAIHQGPVKEAALNAKEAGYDMVMWGIDAPSFSVYREQITIKRSPKPGEVVFTRVNRLHELGQYRVIYQKGGVALAQL